jgi:hypothetical protein
LVSGRRFWRRANGLLKTSLRPVASRNESTTAAGPVPGGLGKSGVNLGLGIVRFPGRPSGTVHSPSRKGVFPSERHSVAVHGIKPTSR